jgi:radical SAM protein with 4Fe4S-binding SPASM domain
MCGRRKLEKEHPELCNFGDIEWLTLEKIANQIPTNIITAFYFNGEPLLYEKLPQALTLFNQNIRVFDTNAKLLEKRIFELIGRVETITISVIENDDEGDEQFQIVSRTLEKLKNLEITKPRFVFRLLGNVGKVPSYKYDDDISDEDILLNEKAREGRWYELARKYNVTIAKRILHAPEGSFNYTKETTIPEEGFCYEILSKLVIDRFGNVYPCVRYNPLKLNLLGNINAINLEEMWNGKLRLAYVDKHIKGLRSEVPLCKTCDYWGYPRG